MTVSFGLINVPVVVQPAVAKETNSGFRQIHRGCGSPIRYLRWCPRCDHEVAWEEVGKGIQDASGGFVEVAEDELSQLTRPEKNAISVEGFILHTALDPIWFDESYFLLPSGSARPYALLATALRKSRRCAVGRLAFSTKERMGAVVARGELLIMHLLHFPAELHGLPSVTRVEVSDHEVALATQLVNRLALPVDLREMRNHTRDSLERLLAAKGATAPAEGGDGFLRDLERSLADAMARRSA